jgi:ribosomal protein S18 acetylase RimI-like enzyme
MKILQLRKRLERPTDPMIQPSEVRLRPFAGPGDIAAWLTLRAAAFAGAIAEGRPWTAEDFQREFLSRPWWRAESMWLAEAETEMPGGTSAVVGSVVLGRSGRPPRDRACLQWLMVAPAYRRRGIGRALVARAEREALERGETEITLETHADWREAVRLYDRLGYVRSE